MTPIISVVIPTLNRSQLLLQAVQSVLQQTFQSLELIIVVDGPDPATQAALAKIDDPRLKVITHAENQGGAASRIHGVETAQGEWIAYLDDDDTWMPTKLARQMEAAEHSRHPWPVISCLSEVRYDDHTEIWPRRIIGPNEPISEYLFVRNTLFQGEGLMQTSTLLVPRALHQAIPLNEVGANHDDWDWILRVAEHPDTGFEAVAEPLATWNLQTTHSHVSGVDSNRWLSSRDWIRSHRDRVTPLAYASFLLAEVAARAAAARDWSAFLPLLTEAITKGKPTMKMVALYLGMWLLPTEQRQKVRVWMKAITNRLPQTASPKSKSPTAPATAAASQHL